MRKASEPQRPNQLRSLIVSALEAASRSETRAEVRGETLQGKFVALRGYLQTALDNLDNGKPLNTAELTGLVRWVADWIPDVNDVLLKRLAKLETALAKS